MNSRTFIETEGGPEQSGGKGITLAEAADHPAAVGGSGEHDSIGSSTEGERRKTRPGPLSSRGGGKDEGATGRESRSRSGDRRSRVARSSSRSSVESRGRSRSPHERRREENMEEEGRTREGRSREGSLASTVPMDTDSEDERRLLVGVTVGASASTSREPSGGPTPTESRRNKSPLVTAGGFTTGCKLARNYLSRAEAKKMLVEVQQMELDLRLEEEVAQSICEAARPFPKRGEGTVSDVPIAELLSSVEEAAKAVEMVATRSKNIKGTLVKKLKMAAQVVRTSGQEMASRIYAGVTTDSESESDTSASAAEMVRMAKKMKDLERENKTLRGEIEALKRALPPLPPPSRLPMDPPEGGKTPRTRRQLGGERVGVAAPSASPANAGMDVEPLPRPASPTVSEETPLPVGERKRGTPTVVSNVSLLQQIGDLIEGRLAAFREEMTSGGPPAVAVAGTSPPPDMIPSPEELRDFPAVRPPIRGVAKILEDRPHVGGGAPTVRPSVVTATKRGGAVVGEKAAAKRKKKKGEKGPSWAEMEAFTGVPPSSATPVEEPAVPATARLHKSTGEAARQPPAQDGETWATVVKRGRGKKTQAQKPVQGPVQAAKAARPVSGAGGGASAPAPTKNRAGGGGRGYAPAPASAPAKVKAKAAAGQCGAPSKGRTRKAPRTACVTLSCEEKDAPGILAEARREISLASVGVPEGMRIRRTQAGATAWEIAGEGRVVKADALAAELRRVFAGRENVKISRPVRTAELRLTGLDDSVTRDEVASAIARAGGCGVAEVKVGEVVRVPNRPGSVWCRCPLTAANAVVKGGRLLIGWARAGVELLAARPLQCFRCLERGHVRANCPSEADRSALCYRCGDPGHLAQKCQRPVRCPICAAAGKPAGHRVGAKACPPPPKGRRTKAASPPPRAAPPTVERLPEGKEAAVVPPREVPEPSAMEVEVGTSRSRGDKRGRGDDDNDAVPHKERKASEEIFGKDYY